MLYGIDGKPLGEDKQAEAAQRLYHVQLMNMMMYQRDMLMSIVAKCNSALEKIDKPEHKLEVRLLKDVRDEALTASQQESVSGFISGVQARLAYEICDRLVTEAKIFDGTDSTDTTDQTNECETLIRELIKRMLEKLAPEDDLESGKIVADEKKESAA